MDAKINDFPEIGKRLKKYRLKAGYTAETLAAAVRDKCPNTGVSRQSIFNIENERRRMDLSSLIEISRTIGINPLSLLCDLSQPFTPIEDGTPLGGMTPIDVCHLFGVNSFSIDTSKNPDAPDAQEVSLMQIALELADNAPRVKEELGKQDKDSGEMISWMYSMRLFEDYGGKPPEDLATLFEEVWEYGEHCDSNDKELWKVLYLPFRRGGVGSVEK